MKEIGGYFEFEFANTELGIHSQAIRLNSARNCLEYIVLAQRFKKVFVPYFTCDVILEPLIKHKISYEFYWINELLEPTVIPKLDRDEAFLYTNYFGIKSQYVDQIIKVAQGNVLIDNSHALFDPPRIGVSTFYSLRKFIGMPDGAFLYTGRHLEQTLPLADSTQRVSHLFKRNNRNAKEGFQDFKKNDEQLSGLPLMQMSPSTSRFVATYDFRKHKCIRERNFLFLHCFLKGFNQLNINITSLSAPLCYPLLLKGKNLKKRLIDNKIYVPTYWPNVKEWVQNTTCVENELVEYLHCLPVDQRYELHDMNTLVDLITCE